MSQNPQTPKEQQMFSIDDYNRTGGPAFPQDYQNTPSGGEGMTLRDYFAAHAPVVGEDGYPDWFEFDADKHVGPQPPHPAAVLPSNLNETQKSNVVFFSEEGYGEADIDEADYWLLEHARAYTAARKARRAWRDRRDALKAAAFRYAWADLMIQARKL